MTSTDITPIEPTAGTDLEVASEASWFDVTMRQAHVLAASGLVPEQYRDKPDDIVVAAMFGRDLGWSPTMALQHVHVVKGKPALSAQSMLALVRGAGHSVQGDTSIEGATVTGTRHDSGDTQTITFGPEDQKRAGLYTEVWRKYPAAMFWARAVSQLCRTLFPDVLMGVSYTPDELRDIGPIDAPSVEVTSRPTSPAAPARAESTKERRDYLRSEIGRLDGDHLEHWESWKVDQPEDWPLFEDTLRAGIAEVYRLLKSQGEEPFDVATDGLCGDNGSTEEDGAASPVSSPSSSTEPDDLVVDGEIIDDTEAA